MKNVILTAFAVLLSLQNLAQQNKTFMAGATVDLSAASLIKNWFVYRIAPVDSSRQNNAISSLNITEKNGRHGFLGMIEFGNWSTKKFQTLPCTLTFEGNDLRIEAGSFNWKGRVYKASDDTLVFGKTNELVYYFRKMEKPVPPVLETGTVTIDLRSVSLVHHWVVYNMESMPGFIQAETGVLRALKIDSVTTHMKYKGKVTFDRFGKRATQDCTLEFSGDLQSGSRVVIVTEGYSWNIELFKADGKELIMGKKATGIRYSFQKQN